MIYRIIIILFLLASCGSKKNLKRDNSEFKTEVVDSGEMKIKRPSDSLEADIPKDMPKNTIIEKRGKNSVIYIKSDDKGNIKVLSKCDSLDIVNKWYKTHKKEEKKDIKEKEKTIDINPILFVYFFVGLFVFVILLKISNKFI